MQLPSAVVPTGTHYELFEQLQKNKNTTAGSILLRLSDRSPACQSLRMRASSLFIQLGL